MRGSCASGGRAARRGCNQHIESVSNMASPYDGAADVVTDAPMERLEVRTFHHSPLAQPPVISSLQAFGATVVVAAILSYLLIFRKPRSGKGQGGSAGSDRGAAEPEEYFRAILGEAKLDSWHGKEQGCQWTQTDEEVEVTTPMPSGAKGRDVSCKVLTASLKIAIQGAVVLEVSAGRCPFLSPPSCVVVFFHLPHVCGPLLLHTGQAFPASAA